MFVVTSPTKVMIDVTSQLSVAVTLAVFCAGTALEQVTVTGPGQVIVGGWLSFTVIT